MKNSYPTPDQKISKIAAWTVIASLGSLGLAGCKLIGSKEYTEMTVHELITECKAGTATNGANVKVADVTLQAIDATAGTYDAVEGDEALQVHIIDAGPLPAVDGYTLFGSLTSATCTIEIATIEAP